MKALVYRRFGGPAVLEWADDWPAPELGPQDVLVQVQAGGINPKDALLRRGKFSRTLARGPLPRVSGLDLAGEVVGVGAAVRNFAMGDRVFGMTNVFIGGVHAELAGLRADALARVPSTLSMVQSAAVPLAAQTALQALRDCAGLVAGQRVLINGASGGVGHFAVQIAHAMGAEVHALCSAGNAGFVAMLGADVVHDYAVQPAHAVEARFDAVFDVFGRDEPSDFRPLLGKRGVYVSTVPKATTLICELKARLRLDRRSRLVQVKSNAHDLCRLAEWIEAGELKPHIEKIYPVARAADAHRHVESRHTIGKIVLDFEAGA